MSFRGQTNQNQEDEQIFLGQKVSKQKSVQLLKVTEKLEKSIGQIESTVNLIHKNIDLQNSHILKTTKVITEEYLNSYKDEF